MFDNIGIAIAVIIGLTQVAKKAGVPTKYIPLLAVVLGMGYGLAIEVSLQGLMGGFIAGLSAVGFYRTAEKTITG